MLGAKIYEHVKDLSDLGLIRLKDVGRTKLITTTPRFSEYFGISSTKKDDIRKWLTKKVGLSIENVQEGK